MILHDAMKTTKNKVFPFSLKKNKILFLLKKQQKTVFFKKNRWVVCFFWKKIGFFSTLATCGLHVWNPWSKYYQDYNFERFSVYFELF